MIVSTIPIIICPAVAFGNSIPQSNRFVDLFLFAQEIQENVQSVGQQNRVLLPLVAVFSEENHGVVMLGWISPGLFCGCTAPYKWRYTTILSTILFCHGSRFAVCRDAVV
jgi:hypothetical protein